MYVDIEDWRNGWYGIGIGLKSDEIDLLIDLFQIIKRDPEQHFHISSEYGGKGGVGDIEIYIKEEKQQNNMTLLGKALGPGVNQKGQYRLISK